MRVIHPCFILDHRVQPALHANVCCSLRASRPSTCVHRTSQVQLHRDSGESPNTSRRASRMHRPFCACTTGSKEPNLDPASAQSPTPNAHQTRQPCIISRAPDAMITTPFLPRQVRWIATAVRTHVSSHRGFKMTRSSSRNPHTLPRLPRLPRLHLLRSASNAACTTTAISTPLNDPFIHSTWE